MNKKDQDRNNRLMPNGIPKWVRCYDDNGGESADQYTVVFSGSYNNIGVKKHTTNHNRYHPYLCMSHDPYWPQGVCMHGESDYKLIDVDKWGFAPAMGRKGHLGKRIPFASLPEDCQKVVIEDYKYLWEIK